jgi:hypothetical protein
MYILTFYLTFLLPYTLWHYFWHILWHYFRHSIWNLFWHSFWQLFWHPIGHSIWQSLWHGQVKVRQCPLRSGTRSLYQRRRRRNPQLAGQELKMYSPIHTLIPQADPYPRSIPPIQTKTQAIQTDPYIRITAGRSIAEFWRNPSCCSYHRDVTFPLCNPSPHG